MHDAWRYTAATKYDRTHAGFTSKTHSHTLTPFFLSALLSVVGGNLRLTVTEAKGNRIFLPHKHTAQYTEFIWHNRKWYRKREGFLYQSVFLCAYWQTWQTGSLSCFTTGSIFNLAATIRLCVSRKDNTADHCCATLSSCTPLSPEQMSKSKKTRKGCSGKQMFLEEKR